MPAVKQHLQQDEPPSIRGFSAINELFKAQKIIYETDKTLIFD